MRPALALLALALLAGCGSTAPRPAPPAGDTPAFRVDVDAPVSCIRAAKCEVRLRLTALGPFKVNPEYPFKFVADAPAASLVDGPGTFVVTDAKTGVHTIALHAPEAITLKISGTFKLSVCTEELCKIETPKLAFEIPVVDQSSLGA